MILKEQKANTNSAGYVSGPRGSLLYGAQNGYTPRLGGVFKDGSIFEEWASNSALVRNNIIAIPYATPEFFDAFPTTEARDLRKVWIDVFSIIPTKISGLNATLTVENDEHQLGASGNLFMQEHTKVTKARSEITYDFVERVGQPINEFLSFLIRYGVGDEYTQAPLILSVGDVRKKFKGKLRLQPFYTGSILYVELDIMNTNVVNAWIAVGVRPETAGEITGERDLATAKEIIRYSVPINAMVDTNDSIKAHAQEIVDNMSIFTVNPQTDTVTPINQSTMALHITDTNASNGTKGGFNEGSVVAPEPMTADRISNAYTSGTGL